MERKKNRRSLCLLGSCVLALLLLAGCQKAFDAKGYVQAVLDQIFQGDVTAAAEIMPDTTKEELQKQYEEMLAGFVDNNIVSGMQVTEVMRTEFIEVCRQIFMVMRYQVTEEKKLSRTAYEVTVEYQPVDVFVRFAQGVKEDSEEIMQKARNGEYKGTADEINAQMQTEFLRHSFELFDTYSQELTYGGKKTLTLKVEADKKKAFSIPDDDLEQLKIKILRLDEIQD